RAQRAEATLPNVSTRTKDAHGVFTRLDADVPDARPHPPERKTPTCLPASDVENRSHAPPEHVLGGRHGEMHLPFERAVGRDPRARIPIPAVEVGGIVMFGHGLKVINARC